MECPDCKGGRKSERTTHTVNRHGDHLFLDDTPAWICAQCGESVFDEKMWKLFMDC